MTIDDVVDTAIGTPLVVIGRYTLVTGRAGVGPIELGWPGGSRRRRSRRSSRDQAPGRPPPQARRGGRTHRAGRGRQNARMDDPAGLAPPSPSVARPPGMRR
jgi:hypothetical protein